MHYHWEDWDSKELAVNWLLAGRDPWHFLTTFVYTADPHDQENPIKLYPDKPYLREVVRGWFKNKKLLTPKSRQMLLSWTGTGCGLWDAAFHEGRFVYFQSAKEEKADKLIQRAYFMWKHLPPCKPHAVYTYCRLKFPDLHSSIEGVPQGADAIRQETASGILSDEMAFQEQAKAAFIAAKPTIDGGGWFWGISSVNGPNFFKELVFDE